MRVNAAPLQTTLNGIHRNIDGFNSVFQFTNTGATQGSFSLAFYWPDGTHILTDTGHVLDPGQSTLIALNNIYFPESYFYGYVVISGYRTITARVVTPDFGLLTGTVYEPDGITLASDTFLELNGPEGHGEGKSLSDSKFYIGGLSPGKYKLTVTSFDYRTQVWDRNTVVSSDYDPILIGTGGTEISVIHQYFNNYDPVADLVAKWFEIFVAHAGRDIEIVEGTEVTLDASWSLDYDPGPLLYRYDVDGDGVWDTPYTLDSRYEYTWVNDFEGTVSVEVFDGELTDTASIQVLVNNYVPRVEIGSDEHIEEGDEVVILATLVEKGAEDPLDVIITWGDGSTETYTEVLTETVETREYRHVYTDEGDMFLQIMVSDPDGGVGVAAKNVYVDNVSPILETGSDVTLNVGELYTADINFQDPGVFDTHTVTVMWQDGTPDEEILIDEPLTDMHTSVSHSFSAGVYDVIVTVSDDDGGVSFYQITVSVVGLPPVADVGGPYFGFEGEVILFEGSGSFDPDNEPLEYRWDFKADGIFDTLWMPQSDNAWIWNDNLDESLILEVRDATATSSDSTTYSIANVPPVAFAGDDHTCNLGNTHYFGGGVTDQGLLDEVSVELDWGDGSPVLDYTFSMLTLTVAIDETHTYTEPGVYTITMYAEDDDGGHSTDTATITIIEEPPIVQLDGPYSGVEGDTIYFDASASYDPEGESLEYRWDFENDGVWDTLWSPSATASKLYLDEYNGLVVVEVRDSRNTVQGEAQVIVENVAPVLSDVSSATAYEGASTGFHVHYSDVGVLDTHTAVVDWGEGTINTGNVDPTTGLIHTSHMYLDDGEYTVIVTATDNSGASASIIVPYHVTNDVPVVVVYPYPNQIDEGMTYTLEADLFDLGLIDTYIVVYDWGDGIVETLPLNVPYGAGPFQGTHLYEDEGVYTITATVTDDDGGIGSSSMVITVDNVAPVFDAGIDVEINENEDVSIHIPISDPGVNDLLQAYIDWGDGNQGMVSIGPNGGPYSMDESHVYTDNGVYTVTITVEDMDGGSTVDTFTAVVHNVAPVISGGVDTTILVNTEYQLDVTVTSATPNDMHYNEINWGDGFAESIMIIDVGPTYSISSTHIYTSRGVYTVQLYVEDDDGGADSISHIVTVIGLPPVASAGGPYTGAEGDIITLDASSSSDPDGEPLRFRWDYENDGIWDTVWSTNPQIQHIWADEFTGEVKVEVEDDEFISSVISPVNIVNVAPTMDIGGAVTLNKGELLELIGFITEPGINDVLSGIVNWGDDSTEESLIISRTPTGGSTTATHVYNLKGEFTVVASITDGDSQPVNVQKQVSVIGLPPVADAGGPYVSEEGSLFTLDASATTDPDLDALLYRWDVNADGVFELDWNTNPVATYTWEDDYSGVITLEVQDQEYTVSTTAVVEILNVAPSIYIGGDLTTTEDVPITLSGTVYDPGVNDILSVEINWGDGEVEQVTPVGGIFDVQHIYPDVGVYEVFASVEDDDGATSMNTITVNVESIAPDSIHSIDVKPGAWPNMINLRSKGILQVAICGAYNFDVADIDTTTINIIVNGVVGPEPVRFSMNDVATPYLGPLGDGHNLTADGYVDLVVVYELEDVVSWFNLQDYAETDVVLRLESELISGADSFEAEDILAISKYKAKTNQGKKK